MARAGKGFFCDFSGKVGAVVGSSWKWIASCVVSPQKKKYRLVTEGEKRQQAKFALASRFYQVLNYK